MQHDLWLEPRWNVDRTRILVFGVVGMNFPSGEVVKDLQRFVNPTAYVFGREKVMLTGDLSDSTSLGVVPALPSIVVSGTKQRKVKFKIELAKQYLHEEVGYTKEEISEILTDEISEVEETYERFLKTIILSPGEEGKIKDLTIGLPLEIILLSWEQISHDIVKICFYLLCEGKIVKNARVRILNNGKTIWVHTNANGKAETIVELGHPVLLGYIQMHRLGDNCLNSLWTNLVIYQLNDNLNICL